MVKKVDASFKPYNANSRENHVGDCVKRALSMAYGIDYDTVGIELNKIKRYKGMPEYNIPIVYRSYISSQGCIKSGRPDQFSLPVPITIKEFCEEKPSGIYLIECSPRSTGNISHIVCIIDGDYWDTWDCSDWYARYIFYISQTDSSTIKEVKVDDVYEELMAHVKACIDSAKAKMPYATFEYSKVYRNDEYSIQQRISFRYDPAKLGLAQGEELYLTDRSPSYMYTIKVNPRLSVEENLAILKRKLWERIREWAYAIRKDVSDFMASRNIKTHPKFRGDTRTLIKLPDWCRDKITRIYDWGSNEYQERYEVHMEALEGDPRIEDGETSVTFYATSIPDLRKCLEYYKKDYSRFGYDY